MNLSNTDYRMIYDRNIAFLVQFNISSNKSIPVSIMEHTLYNESDCMFLTFTKYILDEQQYSQGMWQRLLQSAIVGHHTTYQKRDKIILYLVSKGARLSKDMFSRLLESRKQYDVSTINYISMWGLM